MVWGGGGGIVRLYREYIYREIQTREHVDITPSQLMGGWGKIGILYR
jgi:hypothetical protein